MATHPIAASDAPQVLVRVRVLGDLYHGQVPDGAVYIGRGTPTLQASPYANPYKVSYYGRQGALTCYSQYLDDRPELVGRAREELAGKAVACWCKPTENCHGDELQLRIAEPPAAPHSWRSAGRRGRTCTACSMNEQSQVLGSSFPPVRTYRRGTGYLVAARMPACGADLPVSADPHRDFWQSALAARSALAQGDHEQAFRLVQSARVHQPGNPNLDRYEQQIRDAAATRSQPGREAG